MSRLLRVPNKPIDHWWKAHYQAMEELKVEEARRLRQGIVQPMPGLAKELPRFIGGPMDGATGFIPSLAFDPFEVTTKANRVVRYQFDGQNWGFCGWSYNGLWIGGMTTGR